MTPRTVLRAWSSGLAAQVARVADASEIDDLAPVSESTRALRLSVVVVGVAIAALVLATAGSVIGPGFVRSDVVVAVGAQLVAVALGGLLLERPSAWAGALAISAQLVIVTGLVTMTGGGASPYVALYAPLLIVAGWFLAPRQVALTIGVLVVTELWRVVALASLQPEPEQPLVPLLAFATLAIAAHLVSVRLNLAVALRRRDEVRTAATLRAVQAISTLERASEADAIALLGQVFAARATVRPPGALDAVEDAHVCDDPGLVDPHLEVPFDGAADAERSVLLCRADPFSKSERRLAQIIARSLARAMSTP